MIRAGRDMAPFHTDGRDADFVQEMFNKAYRRKYSKRGISVSLIFTGHFNLNIRLFDSFGTNDQLAQLVAHLTTVREITGSKTPAGPTPRSLNN